jgi:type I restriction enzyme, S subunit
MADLRTIALEEGLACLIDYRGKSPPKSAIGVPVISAKVVKNGRVIQPIEQKIKLDYYQVWMTRGLPEVGDVVMTTEGPLGEVAQLDEQTVKFALAQRVVCMRGKRGVLDNTFLKFLLISPGQQTILASYATGTTVAGISQKALRLIPITIPPYHQQVQIGKLLGALHGKVELNRQMNETLEALARALFKDWFVDFGPTRTKADGRPPYLAMEIWGLFPGALDDEDKPLGWATTSLTEFATLNPESWSKQTAPDTIEYVDLANTKWGVIESTQKFSWSDAPSRAQRILRPGDTIVGTVRPGNGSYSLVGAEGLTGSTGFAVLRPKRACYREFVYLASTSPDNIERLSHLADGAAYPAVRPDVVAATAAVWAGDKVLEAFSALTGPLIEQMEANKRQNITLAQTRDLLLPKLMSGEIRLRDAAKLVEEAA